MKVMYLVVSLMFSGFIYSQNEKFVMEEDSGISFSLQSGIGYYTILYGFFDSDLIIPPVSEPGQPGSMLWNEFIININHKSSVGLFTG